MAHLLQYWVKARNFKFMRIAFFHELPLGGARRSMQEYAKELKKSHQIDLFLVDDREETLENKFYSNIFFYKFVPKDWQGKNWKTRLYKDTIELLRLYRLHRKIAQDIENKDYDFVLVSASKYIEAPFIMRFLKIPFLFFCHDPSYRIIYDPIFSISKKLDLLRYNYEKLNRFIRKVIDRENLKKVNLCVLPSNYIANIFTKIYKKKCAVVYYGVDVFTFKPLDIRKDIDIFYIGSYHPVDGYDLLKNALSLMKIKPKIRKVMIEDEWISDDRQLNKLYNRSKIVVCLAKKEGLGAIPLEAMASGAAVVAVDEAGYKETIINGRTGYLISRDPGKLAEKLDWLLLHEEERLKLSKNARENVIKNWQWKKRAKELEGVILTCLNKTYA